MPLTPNTPASGNRRIITIPRLLMEVFKIHRGHFYKINSLSRDINGLIPSVNEFIRIYTSEQGGGFKPTVLVAYTK